MCAFEKWRFSSLADFQESPFKSEKKLIQKIELIFFPTWLMIKCIVVIRARLLVETLKTTFSKEMKVKLCMSCAFSDVLMRESCAPGTVIMNLKVRDNLVLTCVKLASAPGITINICQSQIIQKIRRTITSTRSRSFSSLVEFQELPCRL